MSKSNTLRVLRWRAIHERAWGDQNVSPVGKLTKKVINWFRNSGRAPGLKLVGTEYTATGQRYEGKYIDGQEPAEADDK